MELNLTQNDKKFQTVAVGVLVRDKKLILLAKRPDGKPYAGFWEFPGGKVDLHERPFDGLVRELNEELGIQVHDAEQLITFEYEYPHARVQLHVFYLEDGKDWFGDPFGSENQLLMWSAFPLEVSPVLPASEPIIEAIVMRLCAGDNNV